MSAQWIKLTGRDGADLFVNMASATMMRPRKHWTRIWFMGARDDHVDVFESPAEIVVSLDERLARHMPASQLAPVYVEPPPRPAPPPFGDDNRVPAPRAAAAMNGIAAKLSRVSAVKVSKPIAPPVEQPAAHLQISETVAEQREQRARRRASAIMDERREQLARKLEALRRERGAE